MSLGDLFPEYFKESFAYRNIDIGKAILIEIEEFDINYSKYIIVVSSNDNEMLLAYVIINTEINTNVFPNPYLRSLHIKIDKANHPFLAYDSFVNCSEIKSFNTQEVIEFLKNRPERVVGNISEEVLKAIQNKISGARTIPLYLKEKFGF